MPLPTQASIVVHKTMPYRGGTKRWSNRYFLNNTTGPASGAAWDTFMDNVVAAEKAIYASWMTIVEVIGYAGGSSLPIHSKTYTQAGTGSFLNAQPVPGDVAACVRYSTTARTSKNHPIYLFNYYHGQFGDSTGAVDAYNPAQKTAMDTYSAHWVSGFSDGSVTYIKAGPRGAVAQSKLVLSWLRHRDFRN